MAFYKKKGSSNMTNSLDIVANSFSLIRADGSLQPLTIGGTIAPVNNPTFTGTVAGVTADSIGLGQVDNTSDIDKPVSIATQAALNTVVSNTSATFASHLSLINNNTAGIASLNTSVNGINSNLTTQLSLISAQNTALNTLKVSTNNTLSSQLGLINLNTVDITAINTDLNLIHQQTTSQSVLNTTVGNNYTSL